MLFSPIVSSPHPLFWSLPFAFLSNLPLSSSFSPLNSPIYFLTLVLKLATLSHSSTPPVSQPAPHLPHLCTLSSSSDAASRPPLSSALAPRPTASCPPPLDELPTFLPNFLFQTPRHVLNVCRSHLSDSVCASSIDLSRFSSILAARCTHHSNFSTVLAASLVISFINLTCFCTPKHKNMINLPLLLSVSSTLLT